MKKNNLYTVATTLNIMQLILSLCVVGVKMLDVLSDFYVRISILALEVFAWILVGMYLFIKYDIIGGKNAFKTAVLSITPIMILTVISALMGYFGDVSISNWLGFAFLGSALSFYNKTAIILTNFIPVADAYLMFFANYGIIFISAFIGFIFGSGSNKRIRKAKAKAEAQSKTQPSDEDLSMTQILEKIDENALQGISDEEDEKLTDIVLEESYDEKDNDDSTTALISIDDDDDDREILGQETVEIISLDVGGLEDEAQNQLRQRYDDMPGTDDEDAEDFSIEDIPDENTSDPIIIDQLYDMDIEESGDISFEEMMNFVEENVTEENGWTFLSEEQSDELLRLANLIPAEEIAEDDEFDEADGEAETEEVTFEDLVSIMAEEAEDESNLKYEPLAEDAEEDVPLFTLAAAAMQEEIQENEPEEETEEVIAQTEELPEEVTVSEEPVFEEIAAEEPEEVTEDASAQTTEDISGEDIEEEIIELTCEAEDTVATAAEIIAEDFSDITIEDIENYVDMDEEDIIATESAEVVIPEITDIDDDYIDIDEVSDISDINIDEILSEDPDLYEEDEQTEEDIEEEIDEDEVKRLIRGEDEPASGQPESPVTEEIDERDELAIIADFVESVAAKEQEVIVIKEESEKKVKVVTEKQIRAQRDKEFDNWLNRKTARLDVKAIRDALKESENE